MTREEAIDILRYQIPSEENMSDKNRPVYEALQTLIPELAESEDERIRKALVKYFKERNNYRDEDETFNGIPFPAIIAYLEKQKEQPTNEEMLRTLRAEYEKGAADTIAEYEQKEQKPIDLHDKINELCSKYPINKYSASDVELSAYHQGVHLGATKIAEYLSEQKPVEWSEEDEDTFNDILLDMADRREMFKSKGETIFAENTQKKIDWLDSHHLQLKYQFSCPQPKQEWSEEDINASVKSYSDSLPMCGEFQSYRDALVHAYRQGVVNTLKSLRSSWKPTEHQMNILKAVKDYVGKGSGYWGEGLGSLIDDLEKLM